MEGYGKLGHLGGHWSPLPGAGRRQPHTQRRLTTTRPGTTRRSETIEGRLSGWLKILEVLIKALQPCIRKIRYRIRLTSEYKHKFPDHHISSTAAMIARIAMGGNSFHPSVPAAVRSHLVPLPSAVVLGGFLRVEHLGSGDVVPSADGAVRRPLQLPSGLCWPTLETRHTPVTTAQATASRGRQGPPVASCDRRPKSPSVLTAYLRL